MSNFFFRRSFASTMSTDADDEGGGGGGGGEGGLVDPGHHLPSASSRAPPVSVLLVTANVGSVFEDPASLVPTWQREMLDHLARCRSQFVAMHFQEVVLNLSFCD